MTIYLACVLSVLVACSCLLVILGFKKRLAPLFFIQGVCTFFFGIILAAEEPLSAGSAAIAIACLFVGSLTIDESSRSLFNHRTPK